MSVSVHQVVRRMTSRIVFSTLISISLLFEVGQLNFCPVTSPNDEVVYVTDTPTKLMIGATKTGCAIDCISSNCRCINYNVTSLNCSVYNFEPKSYAVDKSNNTVAYQLISKPLTGLWSTVPVTNCSFPFIYQGLKYCRCRRGVMFPNDQYCQKNYYSCQLKNGNSAYCDVTGNPPIKTPGCSFNSSCNSPSAKSSCTCNTGYAGDGFNCTDIDECLVNNGGCSLDATCTNNPRSFTCTCNKGFTGNGFQCSVPMQCDQGICLTPTSASGIITSMNYPNAYINNAFCDILITASSPYTVVRLTFTAFCTEARNDIVEVYDGSYTSYPLLVTFSGCSGIPGPVTTTQQDMYVWFTSDSSNVFSGFSATYNMQ